MKVSVITINYNNRDGLKRTLESVRLQSNHDFEYIVIDGGSTDGSRELIEEYEDIITISVSEPDGGIYNAMNKGVAKATGDYCLFLNSGDILHDDKVFSRIAGEKGDADIIFGQVINVQPDGQRRLYVPSDEMTLLLIIQTGIHHAGSFISTELMRKHPYDESLRICSDRKFFIESLVIDNCSYRNLDFPVCDFELGGISFTNPEESKKECRKIMDELFPPRLVADYDKTNVRIQQTTSRLVKSRHKIISMVCSLDDFILKTAKIFLGKHGER